MSRRGEDEADREIRIDHCPKAGTMNWRFWTARDIAAIVLAVMLAAGSAFVLSHPKWQAASGFGPGWRCQTVGGDDLTCFKDRQAKP
jgi:hypothetical protein